MLVHKAIEQLRQQDQTARLHIIVHDNSVVSSLCGAGKVFAMIRALPEAIKVGDDGAVYVECRLEQLTFAYR